MSIYMKTSNQILQHLRENSESLENIQRMYLQASAGLSTIYFYEEYGMPVLGSHRVVSISKQPLNEAHVCQQIVPHHSAVVAGDANASEVGLHGDHCTIVKFSTKDSALYETVLYYLREQLEGANAAVEKKWRRADAQRGA